MEVQHAGQHAGGAGSGHILKPQEVCYTTKSRALQGDPQVQMPHPCHCGCDSGKGRQRENADAEGQKPGDRTLEHKAGAGAEQVKKKSEPQR